MREAKIQCEGVGKTFIQKGNTQVHVLRDVSIDVGRNEFVVILGPGQCGKTTLLRMIAGFEKPSVGRVLMDGREIEGPGHDKGFVFQSYMLFAWRTVRGNVEVGPRVRNLSREERRRLSQQYIDMVGLNGFEEHYPHQLSGGMKQRVGIARAFVSKPRVIFADEPTGNLDSITSKQVLYRMLQISKQMGTTFVMVTHEPELASCADRIITILDGKVQSDVVQDPATRERNREALFASLEGNMRIGGDSASGEVHQKTAAELASYAAPAAAAQQPEQPKP